MSRSGNVRIKGILLLDPVVKYWRLPDNCQQVNGAVSHDLFSSHGQITNITLSLFSWFVFPLLTQWKDNRGEIVSDSCIHTLDLTIKCCGFIVL